MKTIPAYKTITVAIDGAVARVAFNRPEVHNAFNDVVIEEGLAVFTDLAEHDAVRVVVLTGTGQSFCAGADLNWMRRVKDYSYEDNLTESLKLAELFYRIYSLPKPVVGRINGAAIGGGTGFVAVSDIAIAATTARFSFSEVTIGVVPACISPYVIRRIGEGRTREFFLTGERLTAERALAAGLVNKMVPPEDLDQAVDDSVNRFLTCGPEALATCKELLEKVPVLSFEEVKRYTAETIARLRISDEGQEGMAAFLEKRPPKWLSAKK